MSYLLDRKIKRKRFFYIGFFAVLFLILFYFRGGVWAGLSYTAHKIFTPVLVVGNNVGDKIEGTSSFFTSKSSLAREVQSLQSKINESESRMANYDSLLSENDSLKEILGRKNIKASMLLAAILSKPNVSPYDTIIVDVGESEGVEVGDNIFALGNIPIGRVSNVYPDSAKIILFSNSGERTQVIINGNTRPASGGRSVGQVFMEIVGRGGGNFEMIIPRDLNLSKGDEIVLPGIVPYVIGIVEATISDPRDPFTKALVVSPVNIQEIKFVQVER